MILKNLNNKHLPPHRYCHHCQEVSWVNLNGLLHYKQQINGAVQMTINPCINQLWTPWSEYL